MSDVQNNPIFPPPAGSPAPAGQAAPPPPMPPAEPPQKVRRVGTLTMGLSLIAAGVLLIASFFLPLDGIFFVLRFSPLILIFLGIEMLIANFKKDVKIKYDFLSVIVSLILITIALLCAFIPHYVMLEQASEQKSSLLTSQLDAETYEKLKTRSDISAFNSYVNLTVDFQNYDNLPDTLQELRPLDYVQFRVAFKGGFASRDAFAAACREVLDLIQPLAPHINYFSFHSVDDPSGTAYSTDTTYSLWLNSSYQMNWSAAEMSQNIVEFRWLDEQGYYVPLEEYEYYLTMNEDPTWDDLPDEIDDIDDMDKPDDMDGLDDTDDIDDLDDAA